MLVNGKTVCNCPKKNCVNHGKCADCLEKHKGSKRDVYCKRPKSFVGRMLEKLMT